MRQGSETYSVESDLLLADVLENFLKRFKSSTKPGVFSSNLSIRLVVHRSNLIGRQWGRQKKPVYKLGRETLFAQ